MAVYIRNVNSMIMVAPYLLGYGFAEGNWDIAVLALAAFLSAFIGAKVTRE